MTSTELVRVVNPATGEALELASEATDRLASERRGVTDLKKSLDQYASYLDDELTRRLDRMGRRAATVGAFEIETKAPTVTDYPVELVRGALEDLIDADVLDDGILDEVLVPVEPPPVKLNRTRLNTLLKHPDERVRAALEACAREEEQRRTVKVVEKL